MSQLSHDNKFCELLFTKPLAHYFSCVSKTNMNGFNSSIPAPGVWEVYVYEQSNFRSAAERTIREKFVTAVKALGQHLHDIDEHTSGSFEKSKAILKYIRENGLTSEQQQHFDMFFNIVDNSTRDSYSKATPIAVSEYKRLSQAQLGDSKFRVNVKTIISGLEVSGAYTKSVSDLRKQQGGAPTRKLALITSYLPLILPTDALSSNLAKDFDKMKQSYASSSDLSSRVNASVEGTEVGGGLKGGAGADDEDRAAMLRIVCERQFENPTDTTSYAETIRSEFEVASAVEIASFIACRHPEPTNAPSVLSNAVTLAALPTNTWRKLSDGSYEKKTPEGVYKPLSAEECAKLLSTCAGSSLSDGETCTNFMNAVRDQDVNTIIELLGTQDVWNNNTAADSLNDLHPETVLKILKTLKFGTKNGPYGKRVCSVDEWLAECVKNTAYANATISQSMRSYLNHLVSFVNSNPSLIDPSKRPLAGRTTQDDPKIFTERGIYNAYDDYRPNDRKQITFQQVQLAVNGNQYGRVDLTAVSQYPTMLFGAVQQGGQHSIYTQSAQAPISLGSGISQLVQQTLNGLRSTSQQVSPADEALIIEKVNRLTQLEQDIYQHIIQLSNLRVAVDSGVDCYSQLTSTQDNLMHLSNSYNRKVPCLQELCEQLRMLLAQQQQHKQGCEPIQ